MSRHSYLSELPLSLRLPLRSGASPGLLRRRYSVPETVMRKYRLAQQQSDSEYSNANTQYSTVTSATPSSASCGACGGMCIVGRSTRRDREMVRRSALLRRLWGRAPPCCNAGPCDTPASFIHETRSLDGSASDLNHLSSSFTSRQLQPGTNWISPRSHRLELPQNYQSNTGIFKTNVNSINYDKTERNKFEHDFNSERDQKITSSETINTASHCKDPKPENMNETNVSITNSSIVSDLFTLSADYAATKTDSSEVFIETNNISLPETPDISNFSSISTAKENPFSIHSEQTTGFSDTDFIKQVMEENVVDKKEVSLLNYNNNMTNPTYEVLEVVVSETINPTSFPAIPDGNFVKAANTVANLYNENSLNINIDEYVSNILVESLNSLTDQIESMNANICSDRKISIVEKEIKVRLQNTGVNTVVHLSPMSNNQIIFGNEELYHLDENKNPCDNPHSENITIREDIRSAESNNNGTSPDTVCNYTIQFDENTDEIFNNLSQKGSVNNAVLQQIQKLFQEELHSLEPEVSNLEMVNTSISHTESSNNQNSNTHTAITESVDTKIKQNLEDTELISGVGTGNYFPDLQDNPLVPRFTAYPHTESMEVNTSSDDADIIASECTSLVDSLDDPNSPRSMILRRSLNTNKRSELVRSAIDVLDLLPESAYTDNSYHVKEKGESFFIRIKDDNCDCEKENIVVADHMPEKIKQMLYRRHKKRELRMEIVRRNKVNQLKNEINKQRVKDLYRINNNIEKDCIVVIDDLIAETIAKIVQDEYKYMRIKQKPSKNINENVYNKTKKTALSQTDKKSLHPSQIHHVCYSFNEGRNCNNPQEPNTETYVNTQKSAVSDNNYESKRIYQKSEIHEGDKCVEILEILEYVDTSQSSTETNTSEDGPIHTFKNKKSRIPIPIHEKMQKSLNNETQNYKNNSIRRNSANNSHDKDEKSSQLIANMLLSALCVDNNVAGFALHKVKKINVPEPPDRQASVPYQETRPRAHSMKFKRVFDIIPEEKSSLSLESSNEDINYNRRVSAPNLGDTMNSVKSFKDTEERINKAKREKEYTKTKHLKQANSFKETKSAGTSPLHEGNSSRNRQNNKIISKTTMTSPTRRSAATSPMTNVSAESEVKVGGSTSSERIRGPSLVSLREGIALACAR